MVARVQCVRVSVRGWIDSVPLYCGVVNEWGDEGSVVAMTACVDELGVSVRAYEASASKKKGCGRTGH